MRLILVVLSVNLIGFFAQAIETSFWRCEQDNRAKGGVFESVSLVPNGSLFKLMLTYKPATEAHLPNLENIELVPDLHCRFYIGTPRLIQCVSTNFKRYIETILNEDTNLVTLNVKSDLLKWPIEYAMEKTPEEDHSQLDVSDSQNSFCGFVELPKE